MYGSLPKTNPKTGGVLGNLDSWRKPGPTIDTGIDLLVLLLVQPYFGFASGSPGRETFLGDLKS